MRELLHELAQQGWQPSDDDAFPSRGGNWYNIRLYRPPANSSGFAEMIEADDHWVLPIAGYEVSQFQIDYAFGLALMAPDDVASLRIAGSFTYRESDSLAWVLDPEGPRPALAPALAVFGLTIERAVAHKRGRLDLAFSDGGALSVEPDPKYEAWEFRGSGNALVVSMPGGDLAIWSGQTNETVEDVSKTEQPVDLRGVEADDG